MTIRLTTAMCFVTLIGTMLTLAGIAWAHDTTEPETTITFGPSDPGPTNDDTPTFFFTSDDPTAIFGCRLTKQGDVPSDFTRCTSPITYPTLSEDTDTMEVRAEDEAGNEDATPAERTFSVDTTSPKVSSLKATSVNSIGVPLRSTNFRATFSEFMNSTTLNNGNFLLYECPSTTATDCPTRITDTTVRGSRERLKETLNPFGNTSTVLKANTRYKVTMTALDYAGNVLDQKPAKEGNQTKVAFFTTGSG